MMSDAEKALREEIQTQSKGQIILTGFRKKDGREIEKTTYELMYEADLRFESSGMWMTGSTLDTGIGFNFRIPQGPQLQGFAGQVARDIVGGRDVVKGGTAKISGSMVGQKYESGWKFGIREAEVFLGWMPNTESTTPTKSVASDSSSKKINNQIAPEKTPAQVGDKSNSATTKPSDNFDLKAEADSIIRAVFKSKGGEVKSVRDISALRVDLQFELELEFENTSSINTPISTVSINRGDRAKYSGLLHWVRYPTRWRCPDPPELDLITSSSASLVQYERICSGQLVCMYNLRDLDAAKGVWALEKKNIDGATVTETELMKSSYGRVGAAPLKCPSGGVYAINPIGSEPSCSLAGHSLSPKQLKSIFSVSEEPLMIESRGDDPFNSTQEALHSFFEPKSIKAKATSPRRKRIKLRFTGDVDFAEGSAIEQQLERKGQMFATHQMTLDGALAIEAKDGRWSVVSPKDPFTYLSPTPSKPLSNDELEAERVANLCINQLRQIDGAKEQWALENRKRSGSVVVVSEVDGYIRGGHLTCPGGGVYNYGAVDSPPTCSIAEHRLD